MTAFRRSEGPRPGGTDGERASGDTTKILSRWSGGYRDKYGCTRKGGGADERRAPQKSRGQSSVRSAGTIPGRRLATSRGTHDQCGGRRLPGTARIERELRRQRPARYPGDAWQRDKRLQTMRRAPSPKPLHQHPSQVLPAAQVKGRARAQPSGHWDGQQEQHGTGRQSVSGGRRVITGATGEATTKRKTDGEEARGGERGMHARAKWL